MMLAAIGHPSQDVLIGDALVSWASHPAVTSDARQDSEPLTVQRVESLLLRSAQQHNIATSCRTASIHEPHACPDLKYKPSLATMPDMSGPLCQN